jgi:membrane protein required for colicin V production
MEATGQHTFDLIVLGLLLLSGVLALFRGLVREVFALGTWVGATAAAIFVTPLVEPWFHEQIKNELVAKAAAGLSVFCLALLILIPLSNLFASMVKGRTITAIDRSLGFVFGVVRGFLVLFLVYLSLTWVWPTKDEQPKWLAEAKTQPILQAGADSLRSLIPREQQEKAAEEMRKSREAANKAVEDARRLQELATPVPTGKNAESIHYAPEDRAQLDTLSGQQDKR